MIGEWMCFAVAQVLHMSLCLIRLEDFLKRLVETLHYVRIRLDGAHVLEERHLLQSSK